MAVSKRWFVQDVMAADLDGTSESVMVLPWTQGEPSYRDEHKQRPSFTGHGFDFYNIATYAEAPEMIVPSELFLT